MAGPGQAGFAESEGSDVVGYGVELGNFVFAPIGERYEGGYGMAAIGL